MKREFIFLSLYILMEAGAHADEWTLDIGVGTGYLRVTDATNLNETHLRPSLHLGAFRQNADNWRIGTSLESLVENGDDWSNSTNVIMWRMGDIDYRISEDLAINFHGGFARYYREQPAYGYGIGAGLKYRLLEHSYVSFSATRAETDVSTDVPTDNNSPTKNDLLWASLRLHLLF